MWTLGPSWKSDGSSSPALRSLSLYRVSSISMAAGSLSMRQLAGPYIHRCVLGGAH